MLNNPDGNATAILDGDRRVVVYGEESSAAAIARRPVVPYADLAAARPLGPAEPVPTPACWLFTTSGTTRAPEFVLHDLYGMSEVQAMVSRHYENDVPSMRELGGGRLIADGAKVRARDTATGRILPHEESGELEFDMPSRMVGYFGDEAATRAAFTEDGYLRSGDLGYTVEGGFVFQSRMGDALRLSGFLVNPLEIEAAIEACDGIAAAQVVGVDGPRGPYAVAFVVPKDGADIDESAIISRCASRMAGYKVPKRVFLVDAFPVTHSANGTKIQRAKLREMAVQRVNG